jgi:Zn-dependent protease with chaperone function
MGRADSRIRFWALALVFAVLLAPLLLVIPFRTTDRFAATWALFDSSRWGAVRVGGAGLDAVVFAVLIAAGLALSLRDVVPFLLEAWREHRDGTWPRAEVPPALGALVADLAGALRIRPPVVTVVATDAHVFFVRGLAHHRLVVSRVVLSQLDGPRLRAAVAHELAHVAQRDPLAGWVLMAVRLVMCWNPAVQLLARAIVQEMERRADRVAASLTTPEDVTAALDRLAAPADTSAAGSDTPLRSLRTLTEHLDGAHIRARAAALRQPAGRESALPGKLALAGVGLAALLFFVV